MKILVGVDLEGTYKPALNICARLKFDAPCWTLVNVAPPIASYTPGFVPVSIPVADTLEKLHESGHQATQSAKENVDPEDESMELVVDGNPAGVIMRLADEQKVDLIATGSGVAKRGFPWFVGSVSRALSFAAGQSLLITKQAADGEGPLHAVFATDHSDYANCALEAFLEWAPKGLRRIDVLTAYETNQATFAMLRSETDVDLDFEDWIVEHTTKQCREISARFKSVAQESRVMVEKGPVNEVIANAMNSTGADLLILGAQGHGFIERLLVGSTSLHQILSEPYPVLLIRLPK